MKITKLSATGLKSGDFTHNLAPVTVILGNNFQGKTARLQAARLALMGYLPELGKTNQATFQLCCGTELRVSAEYQDGSTVERRWKLNGGTIKAVADQDGSIQVPEVLLDPNVYFSLGDKDRVRYVFGRTKVESILVDQEERPVADAIINRLKSIRLEPHKPEHEEVVRRLVDLVDETDRDRHESEQPVQDWIETLIGQVQAQYKLDKQNVDRMAKTVQGLTAIQSLESEAVIQNVERQIAGLRSEIGALSEQKGALAERISSVKAKDAERARLTDLVNRAVDNSSRIADRQKELAELEAALLTYRSSTAEIGKRSYEAKCDLHGAQVRREELERELEARRQKHTQDMELTCCPFCRSKAKGWKKSIAAEFEAFEADATARLEQMRQDELKLEQIRKSIEQELEVSQALDREHDKFQVRYSEVTREIQQLSSAQQEHAKAKAQLEVLGTPMAESEAAALLQQRDALERDLAGKAQELAELDRRQRAWHQAKQDDRRRAQAIKEQDAVLAEVQVLKEALALLEALQREIVKQAFGRILERANRFTSGILRTPLEYRDGEVGRFEAGVFILHRTFSGVEKALAYVAISAALAEDSPVRVVLLDELGNFDHQNQQLLLTRLVELVAAGVIDQAIVAGTECCEVPGVEVVRL